MGYTPNEWHPLDVITSEKLNELENGLTKTSENVVYGSGGAQQSSDGIHSLTYINKGDALPSNPQVGDTVFMKDGDDFSILEWDGEQWNSRIDPKLSERIQDTLDTAKSNTETLISDNNTQINETINQVAKEQADLAIKDGDFNNKAQAMADKALSDAKANTATVAQETLDTANQNLATAKSELTDGLQKEVSDRTSAVSALDTKAQGYVDTAKTDVLETVNKEVTDRQNAVSALDTKATNAVNQAKSDINDTIKSLSVGGRNYLLNSNGSTLDKWTPVNGWSIISDADRGNVFTFTPTTSWTGGSTNSLSQTRTDFPTDKTVTVSFWAKANVDGAKFHSEPTGGNAADNSSFNITLTTTWKRYLYTFVLKTSRVYFMPVDSGATYYIDDLQLELGNMVSDYKQAPEDIVYDYTDKDNQIKQTFTQYQQSNDGKVSKTQTDVATALGQVATKVSQTDYNTKTGQLQTDLTTTTQTANQAKIDIVSIKQKDSDQDAKMNTIVSDANGTKQTVSDLKTAQGKQSGDISTLQQRADGFDATVTKVDNLSVGGRNYVLNSSGLNGSPTSRPTLIGATSGSNVTITYPSDGVLMTNGATNKTTEWYYQVANAWTNFSATPLTPGTQLTFSADVMGTVPQAVLRYGFNGGTGGKEAFNHFDINNNSWTRVSITFTSTSTNTGLYFCIQGGINNQYNNGWSGGETLKFRNVKIESGNTATDWTPAPEDLSGATAKAQLTADQATTAINTYRTSNDGRVASAESKITQNATDITQKVSKTDYNQKTGQLQTDLNTTTNTANTAKQDIATIKTDNTTRDSKINTLESDSTETKRTISKLSGDLSTVSGDVSTLTQRADGFDATVTKVDNLAVGGRNYLISGTAALGWLGDNNVIGHNGSQGVVYDYISTTAKEVWSYSVWSDKQYTVPADGKYLRYTLYDSNKQQIMRKTIGLNMSTDTVKGQIVVDNNSAVAYIRLSIDWVANGYGHAKFEKGNIPTDWSPAPEDVDSATAKAQLTADNATTALSNYKTDADGRITKAQSDITQTAKDVTTKVSQSDYNKKTGDLTTAVSKAQTTADGVVTTVGNYKTSNDARVKATESKIEQNSTDIAARVTKTELNTTKSEFTSQVSSVQADYRSVTESVTEVKGALNDLQQVNMVLNSEFAPDLSGWYIRGDGNHINPPTSDSHGYKGSGHVSLDSTGKYGSDVYYTSAPYPINSSITAVSESVKMRSNVSSALIYIGVVFYDANKNAISGSRVGRSVTGEWGIFSNLNVAIPSGTFFISFDLLIPANVQSRFVVSQPLMVNSATVGSYVRGQYTNNDKIALQQITIDSISDVVSNPTTGLSTRVQTAEGTLSKVTGADIPALQNATFWQHYSSLNFNDYTKQGSFFFNTTAAKTNGPTTSSAWMYLMVEQGTSAKDRIKQTAWYDGVTGVKITYVRTLNSGTWSPWYANDNDSVTTISQTNSDVRQEIENRKTGDSNTLQSSKDFTTSNISSAVSGINSTITQTANGILGNIGATNLFPNSEFTRDYGWSNKTGTVSYLTNQNIDNEYHGVVRVISTSATYQGYWAKPIPVTGGQKYSASVKVHFTNNGLSNGCALLDLWFTDKAGNRVGSASQSITQTSSPYWITMANGGFTAPINAVYMNMSLITNNAGAGMVADFTMPIFTATDKTQPYTPNDDVNFQLGLFKDNWSIGITDNIGKITSGIVSNASQMSLISKNVTIDSPSTQITGTAWINSAMIGTSAIQTANIADAAITSAKIAQLDVAKLTGNVSSFIQSNWNGNFGSTTIDSTGMEVKTGKSKTKFTNGNMQFITDLGENIGFIGRQVDSVHNNLDYLTFGLNGWHTTYPGDAHYDIINTNTDQYYGGDGMLFGISNADGGYSPLLQWNSRLAASYKSGISGWLFTQPIVGGIDIYGDDAASNKTVSMRFQNVKMSNGFTYPMMTSQQAAGSTGIVIGSGSTYMLGGNSFVWSVADNGYAYYNTQKRASSGASLLMASDGAIVAQSSATKYKTNIAYEASTSYGDKLLTIDPATWSDKDEAQQLDKYNKTGEEPDRIIDKSGARYYGLIAEDMVKAGLEDLIVRDPDTGAVEGIQYEKIGIALIPLLREQRNQINELRVEIERLKEKTNE